MSPSARAVIATLVVCSVATSAQAQWIVWQPEEGQGGLAREVGARLAERGVDAALDATPQLVDLGGDVPEQDVVWLSSADREVALAREELAALDEAAALARVDRLLAETLDHPHVPGVVARRVEALLLRATVVAQRGQTAAEDFAEVARLDAERRLAAAEAPPAVREQADDARSLALAQTAVLVVEPDAPFADVFLDDVLLGPAPIRVGPIAAGRHVIRIEAPAHETFATWLEIAAGDQPAFRPELTPVPELVAWRRAVVALRTGDGVVSGAAPWSWLLVRAGRRDRLAVRGCAGVLDRCSGWVRTTRSELVLPPAPESWTATRDASALDQSTARWLDGPRRGPTRRRVPRATRWYERPWVWAIAGAIVVGAGVTAGVVASAEADTRRVHFVAGGGIDSDERK